MRHIFYISIFQIQFSFEFIHLQICTGYNLFVHRKKSYQLLLGITFKTKTMLNNVLLIMSIEKNVTKFLISIFSYQGSTANKNIYKCEFMNIADRTESWILLKKFCFAPIYSIWQRPFLCINMKKIFRAYECSGWGKI